MSKISMLINQIDFAQHLLSIQMEMEQSRLLYDYTSQLLTLYQKVSLAEKHLQVKNTCSYKSSTNE